MTRRNQINIRELGYTYRYFRDLCPSYLKFAASIAGFRFSLAPLSYLELGFGQGVSINIHAAACDGVFWGSDYNPAQVAFAQSLATASGARVELLADSFEQLARRDDLPTFNMITLHGIWTWISESDRAHIIELVRRKLAPGGLLYVSHNSLTGWAKMLPLRKLMFAHAQMAGGPDEPLTTKVRHAIEFVQSLHDVGAKHAQTNPGAVAQLQALRAKSDTYLAHEFFSDNWTPTAFLDVVAQFGEADLSFVGTTHLMDTLEGFSMPQPAQRLLESISDPVLREATREYLIDATFRKDVFIKTPERLSAREQDEALLDTQFVLAAGIDETPMQARNSTGAVNLDPGHFRPILEALAANDHAPKSLRELAKAGVLRGEDVRQMAGEVIALLSGPVVFVVGNRAPSELLHAQCSALNRRICELAIYDGGELRDVASPVVGGGVPVGESEQLFLLGYLQGAADPASCAAFAWKCVATRVRAERGDIAGDDAISRLTEHARAFMSGRLPILKALGVI
ncbi:MAG: class I SAM-dependent methyltransferase [Proteobacteria bacterium]|nr:class I SAM-dependent methyltransferase [Pseudomonadota bacterium]